MTSELTTINGNTLELTRERIEREHPLPPHIDLTARELLERIERTPWATIATNTAEHTSLSEQQARIHTLTAFDISRQLTAELLEVSPNTIDTHKQALERNINNTQTDFTETILYGADYPMKATSLNLIIQYEPPVTDPADLPERLLFVNHDPITDTTTYIERLTTHREKTRDDILHNAADRERARDRVRVTEHAFIEYDDPVEFAFEAMQHPTDHMGVENVETVFYEKLCELPVFTMRIDEFTDRWNQLKTEYAEEVIAGER